MGSRHLKRLPAPRTWPIKRKEAVWTVKPRPGPHPQEACIPLLVLVRDVLGYAETSREARILIKEGRFLIDGKVRRDPKYPVGLMDVVEVPDAGEAYRVLPGKGRFVLHPVGEEEKGFKLCRIEDKTTVKGGHIQLNLHDGRNVLIRVENPRNPVEDVYKTYDVLKISIPEQEVLEHIKFGKGVYAIVTWGRRMGEVGRVVEVSRGSMLKPWTVKLRRVDGSTFETVRDYVFALGVEKPLISLPGGP